MFISCGTMHRRCCRPVSWMRLNKFNNLLLICSLMIAKHEIINLKFKQINFCCDISHSQKFLSVREGTWRGAGWLITGTSINPTKAYFQQQLAQGEEVTGSNLHHGTETSPRDRTCLSVCSVHTTCTIACSLYNYRCPQQAGLNEPAS